MTGMFAIFMGMALLAVIASLLGGLFLLARGAPGDARNSQRLMRLRVTLQGVALALFLLALWMGT